jgi:4-diphosphocytidyl-2-C-methyl-D-erythritol kinase
LKDCSSHSLLREIANSPRDKGERDSRFTVPSLTEFAPAKINLHLHVVGRRDDGYHLLDSLVVFAGVGDRVSVSAAADLSLVISGPFAAGLDAEADNLVLRAARALGGLAGRQPNGRLTLEKNLPVASGIGGGSADAAAAVRLLCRFWEIRPAPDDLVRLAQRLGADVAVCLAGRAALMSGIGDVLVPAPPLPDAGLLLINPGVAVSTPSVFRVRSGGFSAATRFRPEGWRDAGSLASDLRATCNDLQPPALSLAPEIGAVLEAIASAPHCLLARMSGSGATCFGLFASAEAARRSAEAIKRPGWWVWGGGLNNR